MRNSVDVHNFLENKGIQHELVPLDMNIKNAKEAAEALGLELCEIAKCLVFKIEESPVLIIIPGNKKVDFTKLENLLGKKEIKMADTETIFNVSEFSIRATPPVGLKENLSTIIDEQILEKEITYSSGGEANIILKIKSQDLIMATKASVADITK